MIEPFIIDKFATLQQCSELSAWINNNINTPIFTDANMGGNRLTTRYTKSPEIDFPEAAYKLQSKISLALLKLDHMSAPYNGGMVASCANPGDELYEHVDPTYIKGYNTWHFNVIVQEPESGGVLVVDKKEYDMRLGNLICYPVSCLSHSATRVVGTIPRLMWVFGFCINDNISFKDIKNTLISKI